MKSLNPNYIEEVKKVFTEAKCINNHSIKLVKSDVGYCEASFLINEDHLQHLKRVQGGILAMLAGHAALGAAIPVVPAAAKLVSPEFQISLLRAAEKGEVVAKAKVLKPGKVTFVEVEIYNSIEEKVKLVAKAKYSFVSL